MLGMGASHTLSVTCTLLSTPLYYASRFPAPPPFAIRSYEDAVLGMEAIRAAGFLAAVDVTKLQGYPHLV